MSYLPRAWHANAILATAPSGSAIGSLIGLSLPDKLIVVGVAGDPIPVQSLHWFGDRQPGYARLQCAPEHSSRDETMLLEKAPEAYARMIDGTARFRMVLAIA